MRYISVNNLSDFEFHDSEFTLDLFEDKTLRVKADYLNIHKDTEYNTHGTDMEIDKAYITFEGFNLLSYERGREWKKGINGKLYSKEPQIILTDVPALSEFFRQLETKMVVLDFDIKEKPVYFIDACADEPFFVISFTFDNVIIEWDEYKKAAWYTER